MFLLGRAFVRFVTVTNHPQFTSLGYFLGISLCCPCKGGGDIIQNLRRGVSIAAPPVWFVQAPGAGFTKVQPRQGHRTPLLGRPTLSLMLCCLGILNTFWARAAHSHCVWRLTNPVACLAAAPHLMVTFLSLDYWGGERQFQNQRSGGHFRNHLVQQTRQWFNFTARATKVQNRRIDFLKVMHNSWKRSQIGRLKWWVCKAVNAKAVVSLCTWLYLRIPMRKFPFVT